MTLFSVLESFLRATQGSLENIKIEGDTSSSSSGGFHIDINTNAQEMNNIPWFLNLSR